MTNPEEGGGVTPKWRGHETGADGLIGCAQVHCRERLDPGHDLIQLDIPDRAVHLFCSLKCLIIWAQRQVDPAYRIETAFENPPATR